MTPAERRALVWAPFRSLQPEHLWGVVVCRPTYLGAYEGPAHRIQTLRLDECTPDETGVVMGQKLNHGRRPTPSSKRANRQHIKASWNWRKRHG